MSIDKKNEKYLNNRCFFLLNIFINFVVRKNKSCSIGIFNDAIRLSNIMVKVPWRN